MIALPMRDEAAFGLALESLEQKFAAWMSAMSELQVFLKARGVRAMFTEQPAPFPAGLLVKDKAETTPKVEPAQPAPPPEAPSAARRSEEEEEAMLSTLDTETANWIRVKRRLGGNRRSVRELLEEFREQRGLPKGAEKKRTRR